jgi:hypothetical protein
MLTERRKREAKDDPVVVVGVVADGGGAPAKLESACDADDGVRCPRPPASVAVTIGDSCCCW